MEESYIEGVAIHDDPESCACRRPTMKSKFKKHERLSKTTRYPGTLFRCLRSSQSPSLS